MGMYPDYVTVRNARGTPRPSEQWYQQQQRFMQQQQQPERPDFNVSFDNAPGGQPQPYQAPQIAGAPQRTSTPAQPRSFGSGWSPQQVPAPQAPGMPQMPTQPQGAPAWSGPGRTDASGIQAMIAQLNSGGGPQIRTGGRVKVAEQIGSNAWNDLALARAQQGFDPGAGQFQGKELADEVYSEAQINQLAQQRAAPTIRALQDARRKAAAAGSRGGYVDPARIAALEAQAGIEGAGAMSAATRDAQLDAAKLNAQQAAMSAANQRANFGQDLAARLGLGNMGLQAVSTMGGLGATQRGQEMNYELGRGQLGVTQRGQDIAARTREAELAQQRELAAAGMTGDLYRTQVGEGLQLGQMGLQARGQDLDFGLGRYRAAGDQALGLGNLQQSQYRTQAGLYDNAQDRQTRLEALDRQLEQTDLAHQERAQLERERMDLQRELEGLRLGQSANQFAQSLGLQQQELGLRGQGLAEQQRQFDVGAARGRAENQSQRNLARELGLLNLAPRQGQLDPAFQEQLRSVLMDLMGDYGYGGGFGLGLRGAA